MQEHKWKHPIHKEVFTRIQDYRKIYGERWQEHYFNNFRCLMPERGEFNWQFGEKYLDKKWYDFDWKREEGYSEFLGNKTTRQFREIILETIAECKSTDEQLTDAVWSKKGIKHSFKVFFPIYLKLRESGCSERDLQM